MSDITEMFRKVAPADGADPAEETVEADVVRGRRALARDHRHRTIRRSMAATTSVAAAAVVVLVASQLGGGATAKHPAAAAGHKVTTTTTTKRHPATRPHVRKKVQAIKLVAYTGKQLKGFTVDKVPDGWFLGGVNQFALTIDPAGDTDVDPADFEGKLTVLLASHQETSFPKKGTHVTVNGQPGIIWDLGGVQLGWTDSAGHLIIVQVPNKLGWSDDQMVAFAEGVHVTADALQGFG